MSQQSRSATVLEEHSDSRRVLWRKALVYSPLALAAAAVAAFSAYNMVTSSFAAVVGVIVFGLPAFALGYEAVTALRDLRSQPTVTRGAIARMWNKGTVLWLTRAYYVLVETPKQARGDAMDRHFFVISHGSYLQLQEGQTVEIEHWPHTNTVIRLGLVEAPRRSRSGPSAER